jgi:hypothetical protein
MVLSSSGSLKRRDPLLSKLLFGHTPSFQECRRFPVRLTRLSKEPTTNRIKEVNRFLHRLALGRHRKSIYDLETRRFQHKPLNKDGHLITEDSVLPTTAPGGAPEQNRCYQDARYFIDSPPCARFARALGAPRTAHCATPPLGAGAV